MAGYHYLFEQLVRRELRQKYKGSVLGILWYLVNPLVLMGAYALLFGVFFPQHIADYPIFLMVGILIWTFFSQSLTASATSLLDQNALVRKARFPRETVPAAAVTVQLVTFCAVLLLLVPVALAVRGSFDVALLLLPVLLALLFVFALGCGLMVSVLHAHFRDVAPILTTALLPWFFITPIFFRPDDIGFVQRHHWVGTVLAWGNPIAPFIDAVRAILYDGTAPSLGRIAYCAGAAALMLLVGWWVFRRMERELAVLV